MVEKIQEMPFILLDEKYTTSSGHRTFLGNKGQEHGMTQEMQL